jgi:methylenetetrahydrofolate dehydrogenase (NADP+) / methenyltetrahydrofolate cyclohydrolase
MTAQIIDGKEISQRVRDKVKERARAFAETYGRPPRLEVVLVGEDPASQVYVNNKERASEKVGIRGSVKRLPATISQDELIRIVSELNADRDVDGILVQLPLPKPLDSNPVIDAIDPAKDVDGLTAVNAGLLALGRPGLRPCTPLGCIVLLDAVGYDPKGKGAVIVGRSNLVGKPIAQLLLQRHATVTLCHTRTVDLAGIVGEADIVVAAAGRAGLIKGEWIKKGAVAIDVGINRGEDGKLYGDLDFESARQNAGWITPVPGGVGPMTIAMLLSNVVDAAYARASK